MIKTIWRGIRWFFTPDTGNEKKQITRKHNFAHVKPREEERVNSFVPRHPTPESQAYIDLVTLMQHLDLEQSKLQDVVDAAKERLWVPRGITLDHMEVILQNCGYHRVANGKGGFGYDPRLIEVVTYAMNAYAAQVAKDTQAIFDKYEEDIAKLNAREK